jgi:ABC-type branched-subunit amino acid transport system substrate-binding protein
MQAIPPGDFGDGLLNLATQAAVDYVNAHGGVQGHPLQLDVCYDGTPLSDPNTTAQCAAQAVSDHALALVGTFTTYTSGLYPTLGQASIPNISEVGITPLDHSSPLAFPLSAGADSIQAAMGIAAGKAGCKKATMITPSTLALPGLIGGFAAGLKYSGAQVGAPVVVPATQADFGPSIAKVLAEGADCVQSNVGSQQTEALLTAIQGSGQKLTVIAASSNVNQGLITQLGSLADGMIVLAAMYPDSKNTPQQQVAEAAFLKYENLKNPFDLQYGCWIAVQAFAEAAGKALTENKPLTGQTIVEELNTLNGVGEGLTTPIDFSAQASIPQLPRVKSYSWVETKDVNGMLTQVGVIDSAAAQKKYSAY